MRDKIKLFEHELNLIQNIDIKRFTVATLLKLPEYFWVIPASSTGKYHPKHALGEEGLVRHTICAVRVAESLFTIMPNFTDDEKDMIISALILHDGMKKGLEESKYTKHEHPDLMADFIIYNDKLKGLITLEQMLTITDAIRTHMGQWNSVKYSKVILKTPQNHIQKFVHLCDYLASRKFLNLDLEEK